MHWREGFRRLLWGLGFGYWGVALRCRFMRNDQMRRVAAFGLCTLLVVTMLTGCGEPPQLAQNWTAFVYPDIKHIPDPSKTQNYTIGTYLSFDACQQAAIDRVRFLGAETGRQADYQCGLKCRYREEYAGYLICKEVRK